MAFSLDTTISGNLTRDPELNTKGSTPRTTLSIATTFGKGTEKELTEFTDVFVFGELAENAVKSLRKGSMVDVVARIRSYKQDVVIDGEEKSITRHRFTANQVSANLRFATAELSKVGRSGGSSAPAAQSASDDFEGEAEAPKAPAKAPAKRPAPAAKKPAAAADDDFDF